MLWTLDVSQVWELSGIYWAELCWDVWSRGSFSNGMRVMAAWQHDACVWQTAAVHIKLWFVFSLVRNIHVVYVLHCVLICVLHCVLLCTSQFVNCANLPAWECWKWTGISVRFDNISGPPVQLLIRFSVIGTVGLPTGCRCAAAQVVIKNLTVTVHLKIIWTAVNR